MTIMPSASAVMGPALSDPCAMLSGVETRSVSPVFVGRAGELAQLTDALARATAGEPQALLVGGEAGVGKTRLVEEFFAAACRQDVVVAVGGCVEIGADGLPFAPFSTALRTCGAGSPTRSPPRPRARRTNWPGCCPNSARPPATSTAKTAWRVSSS